MLTCNYYSMSLANLKLLLFSLEKINIVSDPALEIHLHRTTNFKYHKIDKNSVPIHSYFRVYKNPELLNYD